MDFNGAALRVIRERSGLRVNELAALAKMTPSHLTNIEANRRRPSPAVAKAIADALNVPIVALLARPTEEVA